jgi:hypothetical protein
VLYNVARATAASAVKTVQYDADPAGSYPFEDVVPPTTCGKYGLARAEQVG